MRLTPLDIHNHRFSRRLRGVDPLEVEGFLQLVSEDYEVLIRDRDALAEQLRRLEGRVEELSRNERILQETLVTAKTLSDDLKKTALKESEVMIAQAEVKAEKILEAAQRRAARLTEDIREMKTLRTRLASSLRETIQTHLALIDTLGAADAAQGVDVEPDKVAYLARPARSREA